MKVIRIQLKPLVATKSLKSKRKSLKIILIQF